MNRKQPGRWLIAAAAAAAAMLGTSSAALAEQRFVKNPNASLLEKKFAGSSRLAQLNRGQALEVVGREGSWLKVKVDGKAGYVHENSVMASAPEKGGLSDAMKGFSSSADPASSAEAGKGAFATEWAKTAGKNPAGLDRMLALREQVASPDFEKFTTDGSVGPAKK